MKILRLANTINSTSAPYNQFSLGFRNEFEQTFCSLLENDIDLPYSCQSGVCTACQGKLLKGTVSMDVSDGLSDEEIEEGYILCCQSHPTSDEVEIEIE